MEIGLDLGDLSGNFNFDWPWRLGGIFWFGLSDIQIDKFSRNNARRKIGKNRRKFRGIEYVNWDNWFYFGMNWWGTGRVFDSDDGIWWFLGDE